MANKKNGSLSDKVVKNAAGGRVDEKGSGYIVYDNNEKRVVADFYGPRSMQEKKHDAELYDVAYRRGIDAGGKIGYHIGKREAYKELTNGK